MPDKFGNFTNKPGRRFMKLQRCFRYSSRGFVTKIFFSLQQLTYFSLTLNLDRGDSHVEKLEISKMSEVSDSPQIYSHLVLKLFKAFHLTQLKDIFSSNFLQIFPTDIPLKSCLPFLNPTIYLTCFTTPFLNFFTPFNLSIQFSLPISMSPISPSSLFMHFTV